MSVGIHSTHSSNPFSTSLAAKQGKRCAEQLLRLTEVKKRITESDFMKHSKKKTIINLYRAEEIPRRLFFLVCCEYNPELFIWTTSLGSRGSFRFFIIFLHTKQHYQRKTHNFFTDRGRHRIACPKKLSSGAKSLKLRDF